MPERRDRSSRGGAVSVTVLGSINMDTVLRVTDLPRPGETVLASAAARHPGGKGANQAIAAARAGAAVRMIGAVGDDADGQALLAVLRRDGVDCVDVRVAGDQCSGAALVVVDAAGENQIVVVAGANAGVVSPAGARQGVLLAQLELPLAVVSSFLTARCAGSVTVLNAAPFHADARPLLALADVVVVNEVELAGYSAGVASNEMVASARGLLGREGQTIVVTRGCAGSIAVGPDSVLVTPAGSVKVADTTGAGDCFCGYLAAGIAAGESLSASIDRAHLAAAIAVGRHGAASSIPWLAELGEERRAEV